MQHCSSLPLQEAPQLLAELLHQIAACIVECAVNTPICHPAQDPGCSLPALILAVFPLRVIPHKHVIPTTRVYQSQRTLHTSVWQNPLLSAHQTQGLASCLASRGLQNQMCFTIPVAHSYRVAPKLYMSAAGVGSTSASSSSGATYLPSPSSQSCSNEEQVRVAQTNRTPLQCFRGSVCMVVTYCADATSMQVNGLWTCLIAILGVFAGQIARHSKQLCTEASVYM